jgi:hypothetical protein
MKKRKRRRRMILLWGLLRFPVIFHWCGLLSGILSTWGVNVVGITCVGFQIVRALFLAKILPGLT